MKGYDSKHLKLVRSLIAATQKEEIGWDKADTPDYVFRLNRKTPYVFYTRFKSQKFRLYEYTEKRFSEYTEDFYWHQSVCLEFVDQENRSSYEVPEDTEGLHSLIEAVKFKANNVEAFLDKL